MNIIETHLGGMLVIFGVTTFVQFLTLSGRVNNIADPLVFFALTSSFTLGLAYYTTDSQALFLRIVGYYLCFYAGFLIATKPLRRGMKPLQMSFLPQRFRVIVLVSCMVFLAANVITWSKAGVILLSEDPSLQKSAAYAGGLGFVRRINWGLGVFVLVAALYWWLWERSRTALVCLCVALLTSVTGGGKSALLPMIYALGLFFVKPFSPASNRDLAPTRKILFVAAALAAIPIAAVLMIEGSADQSAANALLVRLFFSGDILLYWGQADLRAHFSIVGPVDYVRDSFGSLLGMLRLIEYSTPIGNQFVQYFLPVDSDFSESLGPNLPFYVRGELYFGPWFAPFHALVIGYIVGRVRMFFVTYRGTSLLRYSISVAIICLVTALPVEEGLAIGQLTDFLLVLALVMGIAHLFTYRSSESLGPAPRFTDQKS